MYVGFFSGLCFSYVDWLSRQTSVTSTAQPYLGYYVWLKYDHVNSAVLCILINNKYLEHHTKSRCSYR